MGKKVRFPLEMENGLEVRSVEELREHFSLSRVLGYVKNGKLIIWLRDRYEDEIASKLEQLDFNDEEAVKNLCDIFEVDFTEESLEEIEKAEERQRKLELLKQYPECEAYSKQIDLIAFDQDDLYDLLDEDENNHIYLCGTKFTIPISKNNKKYIGIINGVTVVINSRKIVDFTEKNISFSNCTFDEKYQQLLVEQINDDQQTTSNELIGVGDTIKKISGADNEIESDEINAFIADIKEVLEDFRYREYENEYDELYEYDGNIECDPDYYNDYGFSTKAKAKAACKTALTNAIKDTKELYEESKKELIEATETYYEDFAQSIINILPEFYESFENLIDVHCTEKTAIYLKDTLELKKRELTLDVWENEVKKSCKNAMKETIETHFDDCSVNIKSLQDMCDIEEDEDDEDEYSYNIGDACEEIVDTLEDIINCEVRDFPEHIYEMYGQVKNSKLDLLTSWVESISSPKVENNSTSRVERRSRGSKKDVALSMTFEEIKKSIGIF